MINSFKSCFESETLLLDGVEDGLYLEQEEKIKCSKIVIPADESSSQKYKQLPKNREKSSACIRLICGSGEELSTSRIAEEFGVEEKVVREISRNENLLAAKVLLSAMALFTMIAIPVCIMLAINKIRV